MENADYVISATWGGGLLIKTQRSAELRGVGSEPELLEE